MIIATHDGHSLGHSKFTVCPAVLYASRFTIWLQARPQAWPQARPQAQPQARPQARPRGLEKGVGACTISLD